jgi:hypothetical protein
VNPVISALQESHISVTALHSHMLKEEPRLFFMHFWGIGSAEEIGGGIKAALARFQPNSLGRLLKGAVQRVIL